MANQFGPWATLIDIGGGSQLSAFWQRRMTMLVPTSQTSPMLSWRNLLCLVAVGALMIGLPTYRAAVATPAEAKAFAGQKASAPIAVLAGSMQSDEKHFGFTIVDEHKRPIPSAEVRLFEQTRALDILLSATTTDKQGRFRLEKPSDEKSCKLAISKKGYASRIIGAYRPWPRESTEIGLSKPATLSGTVTDPEGQPVAGAKVWTPNMKNWVPGLESAITDEHGRFEISDLMPWVSEAIESEEPIANNGQPAKPKAVEPEVRGDVARKHGRYLRVSAPKYGTQLSLYAKVPGTVDVTFVKPAILTGRVVDQSTGKPLVGIRVNLQSSPRYAHAMSDENGKFSLRTQGSGPSNLWCEQDHWRSEERHISAVSGSTVDLGDVRIMPGELRSKDRTPTAPH